MKRKSCFWVFILKSLVGLHKTVLLQLLQRYWLQFRSGNMNLNKEDIKKRWQEYTKELYKKDFHDPDNHDGVITHLEPDILEYGMK